MAVVGVVPRLLAEYEPEEAQAAAPTWVTDYNAWLVDILAKHRQLLKELRVEEFQAAYDDYLESIEQRDKNRGDDVNHKIQASLAGLLIDTPVDYMLGKPIVWAFEDRRAAQESGEFQEKRNDLLHAYREDLLELLNSIEGQRVFREMLTQGSIAGYSAAIGWVDEDGQIDYEEFPVQEVVPIFDSRGRLRMVIRFYDTELYVAGQEQPVQVTKAEVYDQRYVLFLVTDEARTTFSVDPDNAPGVFEHRAARIPVSVYLNGTPATYKARQKKAGVSDLAGGILDLVKEYASGISDKANMVDRLQDAFLVFVGATLGNTKKEAESEVMAMRKARAIALKNIDSDAKFIAPPQDDKAVENHLNRVRDTLHEKGFIPKLTDLQGATATEIKLKYAAMDIKAGKKEVYFTGAVKRLLGILTDFLNARRLTEAGVSADRHYAILTGKENPPDSVELYNVDWVQFTFNRNLPQNYLEIAQIVAQLAGIVPDSYLYELLWFIEDPQAAIDEMKQQKEEAALYGLNALGFGGEFGSVKKTVDDNGEPTGDPNSAAG